MNESDILSQRSFEYAWFVDPRLLFIGLFSEAEISYSCFSICVFWFWFLTQTQWCTEAIQFWCSKAVSAWGPCSPRNQLRFKYWTSFPAAAVSVSSNLLLFLSNLILHTFKLFCLKHFPHHDALLAFFLSCSFPIPPLGWIPSLKI